ncbi:MAG: protein kinase [Pirellulaceae bacterium]
MNEQEIFLKAIEIEDREQRANFVQESCGDDQKLKERLNALLQAHDQASRFMETPAAVEPGLQETTIAESGGLCDANDVETSDVQAAFLRLLDPPTREGWLGRLGHYEIEEILGQGAFGIVAKAFDEKLHRVVAIKMMSPALAATSPPRKRFLREARTSAAVQHENIVGIHAVEEQPIPFLVMEYIAGQTLQQRMDGHGPFTPEEVITFGQQIAAGLAAAHAVNLIHRDIKPSNILLTDGPNERAKITDFGLARAVDDASMTRTGTIAGTPMYMAPEQVQGETLDHRADLFSLGSVLYQMASGRPPFRASNTIAVLKRVCDDTPRPINDIIPGTPDWLCGIIARLLEKDRSNRFQTAEEVAGVLGQCQRELDLHGKVVSFSGTKKSRHGLFQRSSTSSRRLNEPARSSRGVLVGAILLMLALPLAIGIAPRVARWMDTPVPKLPAAEVLGGLSFDGKDDWVEFPQVMWNYPQFTIEAMVTSRADSDNGTIVQLAGGDGEDHESMSLYDGGQSGPDRRISGAAIKGKTPFENAYAPLVAGERQHRALVYDGRHLHYYINGVWQGKRYAQPHEGLQWKMKRLRIGCDRGGRRFWQGTIDGLRVSRVARYEDNFAPVTLLPPDEVTLAAYDFSTGQGPTLKDLSGNGLDGTIHGAKWLQSSNEDVEKSDREPSPPIVPSDVQRAAAVAVINAGGSVAGHADRPNAGFHADTISELPSVPFVIEWVNIAPTQTSLDEVFDALGRLPHLDQLYAGGCSITDENLSNLTDLDLRMVVLSNTFVTDRSADVIASWKRLVSLQLSGGAVGDDTCIALAENGSLAQLRLSGIGDPNALTERGFEALAKCSNLSLLVINNFSEFRAEQLRHLSKLSNLRRLDLFSTALGDEAINELAQLQHVGLIRLWSPSQGPGTSVVSADAATRLQDKMPRTRIDHPAVSTSPEEIDFAHWVLSNHPSKALDASGKSVDQENLLVIENLVFDQASPSGNDASLVSQARCLASLTWPNLQQADQALESLAKGEAVYWTLRISDSDITSEGLKHLSSLSNLNQLWLDRCERLDDEALSSFPDMLSLWRLGLRGGAPLGEGLQYLSKFPNLQELEFERKQLDPSALRHLISLAKLRRVSLMDTNIDDSAIEHLSKIPSLRFVDLSGNSISQEAIERLHRAIPKCAIRWNKELVIPAFERGDASAEALEKSPTAQLSTSTDPQRVAAEAVIQAGGIAFGYAKHLKFRSEQARGIARRSYGCRVGAAGEHFESAW